MSKWWRHVRFRALVDWCVEHRWITIGATVLMFALGILGMGKVQQQFFPDSSRREILVEHDQETLASVGVALERAMGFATYDDQVGAFKEALDTGQTLYGRSPDFDVFLRSQRRALIPPEELPGQLEQFLVQIAGLSQY